MVKILTSITISISFAFADCLQLYRCHHYLEDEYCFDIEEFLFGEDNCCDEYPISFCNEETVFYVKEDYANVTDPQNWDIISESVALIRGDSQMLYNPLEENSYNYGVSPVNTSWKARPAFGQDGNTYYEGYGVLAIIYIPKFLPSTMGSFYSHPDDQYYDIHFTSWTSGNGTGWPGGGSDGSGNGGGGGVAYWRSGPINASPKIIQITDIPDDQGGRVYITINRSLIDVDAHPSSLDLYTVKRFDSGGWVNIGSFQAEGNPYYIVEASTLLDSTSESSGLTAFKILGESFEANYSFESEIGYGYSIDNTASMSDNDLMIPKKILLHQNYPNPFNPITKIIYDLPKSSKVVLEVKDVKGGHVKTLINDYVQKGSQYVYWDAKNKNGEKIPSGVYFYTLKTEEYFQTKKMIFLK